MAGKQSIFRIYSPGGGPIATAAIDLLTHTDTYTPSSGIWQTVWVENVPDQFATSMTLWTSLSELFVNLTSTNLGVAYDLTVFSAGGGVYAQGSGTTGQVRLWCVMCV